jgi:glycogen debranching enzyme
MALSGAQHRRRDRILTQAEPAKIRESVDAIVMKHGRLYMLSDRAGDVPWGRPHAYGLFDADTRVLDGYVLWIDGQPPTALSATDTRGFEARHDLTNPELPQPGGGLLPRNTLAIRRERLVRADVVHELLSVRNCGAARARITLALDFRARFEDIFVIKRFVRGPRGVVRRPRVEADRVHLVYDASDGTRCTTVIAFSPAPTRLGGRRAEFACTLAPGERRDIGISITACTEPGRPQCQGQPGTAPARVRRWLERLDHLWLSRAAEVRSSNPLFDRVMLRALLDLRLLRSSIKGQHFFCAGVPWFSTLFGRDAATVAIQTLPYGAGVARDTLRLLARFQARQADSFRDAEPGKILHEYRAGELAHLSVVPQSPAYYGTVDATPLFLILLAEYVAWSGDRALAHALRPNIDAALGWLERFADHDGDGYVDYTGRYPRGLINQGWKDSGNAILDADGALPDPPIALCEVQAYVYRAWRQTAALLRALGDGARAEDLERRAAALHARFERDFWSEALGGYLLARQAGGRPVAQVASNMGQVLWGGIAGPARAARVAARLLADDMFSGWGVRTLSTGAAGFNPISYHLGSVWPHDNGIIVAGLCRYEHEDAALRVFGALFDAAAAFRHYRLPELFAGYARSESDDRPVRYPVACSPQAWAAGAIPHALWNLLGLRAAALEHRLDVVRPRLPAWLDWLEIRDLRVGAARADLRFERGRDGRAAVQATVKEGPLTVAPTEASPPADFTVSAAA